MGLPCCRQSSHPGAPRTSARRGVRTLWRVADRWSQTRTGSKPQLALLTTIPEVAVQPWGPATSSAVSGVPNPVALLLARDEPLAIRHAELLRYRLPSPLHGILLFLCGSTLAGRSGKGWWYDVMCNCASSSRPILGVSIGRYGDLIMPWCIYWTLW